MFSNFDARKSWQKATKFREHLSFINTQQQQSPQQPPNIKSAWSPITPSESGHGHFTLMSSSEPVPPVPPIPAIHASHIGPVERDPDEQRSIERARAEAAAALERGSRERQLERERLDRERQQRLLEKERQQQAAAATSFFNVSDDNVSGRGPVASLAPSSFTSRSKAAFTRLSRAVFRLTSSPAADPLSPFPRDSMAASSFIPRRLTDLSPWPPLNVSEKEREEAARVHHHHYYGVPGDHSRSHSRAGSQDDYTAAEDHMHRDLGDVEKGKTKGCPTCHAEHRKHRRRSTIWCLLLFLLILALIGNIVFLNIRVLTKKADVENPAADASNSTFNPSSSAIAVVQPTTTVPKGVTVTRSGTATATSSASASSGVPAAVSSCLSQFTSSASSPGSYPCGQCVPILSAIPNDLSSSSSSTSITGQGNILQFCALQAINAGLSSSSSSALTSVGWMKDTKPCTWQGVSCDGQGRINQLELVAPGVPTAIPDEVQFLVGLTSLKITGDNSVPSGSLSPLLSISSLQNLDLVQTGLQGSMDDQTTFASLSGLTSLTLVKNTGITIQGNSVGGTTGMNLKSLILNFQSIPDNTLTLLASSSSNPISSSLSTLSLSNSNQAGAIPAALPTTLPNLVELHLDGNAYSTLPDPSTNGGVIFPSQVSVVTLQGNSGMTGTISAAECQALQSASSSGTCDFSGTGITLQGGVTSCGTCVFGSI